MKSILIAAMIGFLSATTAVAGDYGTPKDIVVYKNPQCGCCTKWVTYLEGHGYNVTVDEKRDVYEVKEELGVPVNLAACHTAIIDGYIVEGHITHRDIQRLLLLRPDVKGIAVPGMPVGTPGMEVGDIKHPYNVISFDENGMMQVFAEH